MWGRPSREELIQYNEENIKIYEDRRRNNPELQKYLPISKVIRELDSIIATHSSVEGSTAIYVGEGLFGNTICKTLEDYRNVRSHYILELNSIVEDYKWRKSLRDRKNKKGGS